jgi:2-methylcitrate dehydratase PrpD
MLAERLGAYLAEIRFSDLPPGVVKLAKERLLDLFSAGLAGYRLGLYRPVLAAINVGAGHSMVWGEGKLVPAGTAATINSFMAHCTYLEDGSRSTGGHPSSAVIPAILALAEERGISGEKVLLSIVVGYEIFIRIGKAIYPSTVTRGFQPTAILAALGAAGGCAKLLDLDADACAQALAIGANLGSGLKAALKESASESR